MASKADHTFSSTSEADSSNIESDRFHRFKIVVYHAIEQLASGVSEEDYIQMFGKLSVLSKSRTAPIRMQNRMKNNLVDGLTEEINRMVTDERVCESFNKLDNITDECALYEGETAWRPNGNVTDHMRSHVMDVKLKHIAALQEEVKRREQATEQLQHEVSCFRNHVTSLSLKLQSIREHNMDCELLDRISAKVIVLSNRVCTC